MRNKNNSLISQSKQCFGYSKGPSQSDDSFQQPKRMGKKMLTILRMGILRIAKTYGEENVINFTLTFVCLSKPVNIHCLSVAVFDRATLECSIEFCMTTRHAHYETYQE